jgi:hypothetical protein
MESAWKSESVFYYVQ